ncbi:phage holin family protein [Lentibacillus juripiscarius]|uniref:Phage holin family protein n=1 Tax=Lentibacillus juripiscarius TaxID=257446 RepID=A0ABW5V8F0_9BACI
MTGLIVKLLVCPIGLYAASWLFPNVDFGYWYQPIILGVVLAFVGYFMEKMMLREETNWLSVGLDFVVTALIVYFGSMLLADTAVTFWGAVLTGALLGITEIFQHNWLLSSDRVKKTVQE